MEVSVILGTGKEFLSSKPDKAGPTGQRIRVSCLIQARVNSQLLTALRMEVVPAPVISQERTPVKSIQIRTCSATLRC